MLPWRGCVTRDTTRRETPTIISSADEASRCSFLITMSVFVSPAQEVTVPPDSPPGFGRSSNLGLLSLLSELAVQCAKHVASYGNSLGLPEFKTFARGPDTTSGGFGARLADADHPDEHRALRCAVGKQTEVPVTESVITSILSMLERNSNGVDTDVARTHRQ